VQLNQRREACEVKSTTARNDYLLSLAATNAHLQHYYNSDTPELMKVGHNPQLFHVMLTPHAFFFSLFSFLYCIVLYVCFSSMSVACWALCCLFLNK